MTTINSVSINDDDSYFSTILKHPIKISVITGVALTALCCLCFAPTVPLLKAIGVGTVVFYGVTAVTFMFLDSINKKAEWKEIEPEIRKIREKELRLQKNEKSKEILKDEIKFYITSINEFHQDNPPSPRITQSTINRIKKSIRRSELDLLDIITILNSFSSEFPENKDLLQQCKNFD